MIVGHIMGIPVEETALQFAPTGAAIVTAVAIAGRTGLGRLRVRLRHARSTRTRLVGARTFDRSYERTDWRVPTSLAASRPYPLQMK
jgi:hypothetical protein